MSTERTFASTSQLYDVRKRDWAYPLLDAVGLPSHMLGDIRDAGELLGPLLPEVAEETGASGVNVVLPGTHDTASAVAAVPAGEGPWAFLSSGTWSLLGIETLEPVMKERAKAFELGNEVGVLGTMRPLKNISGLWLVQQCRATWEAEGNRHSYAELTQMAEASSPFTAMIDPDDPTFTPAGDMPARIAGFCARTGQAPPSTPGEFVRTVLESLALRYRMALEAIEGIVDSRMDTLHIVGGGGQNLLLNQFTGQRSRSSGRRGACRGDCCRQHSHADGGIGGDIVAGRGTRDHSSQLRVDHLPPRGRRRVGGSLPTVQTGIASQALTWVPPLDTGPATEYGAGSSPV